MYDEVLKECIVLLTSIFPIVWNAVNTNINANPNIITFKNLLSRAILKIRTIKCLTRFENFAQTETPLRFWPNLHGRGWREWNETEWWEKGGV
jgi:hypothetical protein